MTSSENNLDLTGIAATLMKRVDRSGGDDACWLWMGSRRSDGYGRILRRRIDGSGCVTKRRGTIQAHRAAWIIANGRIPDGTKVCHSCDNPCCVNPRHLFLGSTRDNNQDRARKRRSAFGERSPNAKLTTGEVLEIRRVYASKGASQQELAERFGVTQSLIHCIVYRKIWVHV